MNFPDRLSDNLVLFRIAAKVGFGSHPDSREVAPLGSNKLAEAISEQRKFFCENSQVSVECLGVDPGPHGCAQVRTIPQQVDHTLFNSPAYVNTALAAR
jgi:hypothetical protein